MPCEDRRRFSTRARTGRVRMILSEAGTRIHVSKRVADCTFLLAKSL